MLRKCSELFSFVFVSNPMEKREERLRYDVSFNPPGAGLFFSFVSAARALGIEIQGQKKEIFAFLKSHQLDVSIQPIANYRTTRISLLCQLAAIFTDVFGQTKMSLVGAVYACRGSGKQLTRRGSQICHPPSPIAYVRIINNLLRELMLFTSKIVQRHSQLKKSISEINQYRFID